MPVSQSVGSLQAAKGAKRVDDFSENLFHAPTAFKILYHKTGVQLANAMLAMAYHQTNFDCWSYEIVLQQYMDLLQASKAAFDAMCMVNMQDNQDDVEVMDPHAVKVTVILLLVALG